MQLKPIRLVVTLALVILTMLAASTDESSPVSPHSPKATISRTPRVGMTVLLNLRGQSFKVAACRLSDSIREILGVKKR